MQTRLICTAEGSDSAVAEPDPQDAEMAPPAGAPSPTLLQLYAEAFRIFLARNLELHPRSEVRFEFLNNKRIAAGCDGEHFFGALKLDLGSDLLMVHHHDRKTGAPVVAALDAFVEQAAATLLHLRRRNRDAMEEALAMYRDEAERAHPRCRFRWKGNLRSSNLVAS